MILQPFLPIGIAAGVGILSGTHTAIWGMYKDAVHEGFSAARFTRSITIGAGVAAALSAAFHALGVPATAATVPRPSGILLMFGLAYAGERAIVEIWKTFFRDEDQSKYTIPMQFNVGGAVLSASARRFIGSLYIAVLLTLGYGIARLEAVRTQTLHWPIVVSIGLVVGLVIACGGAWKDAPTEGFDALKFLRSPAMTLTATLLLATLTASYIEMAIAAIGYERAAAETYKTFFFPSKPRGKFAGKPVLYPRMLSVRRYFVPVFVAIWLGILTAAAALP